MAVIPGVMLYFKDTRNLRKLTDAEVGQLLRAVLAYAETGDLPPFADDADSRVGLLWDTYQQIVDADTARYASKTTKSKYARYCGAEKAAGRAPIKFSEWANGSGGSDAASTMEQDCSTRLGTNTSSYLGMTDSLMSEVETLAKSVYGRYTSRKPTQADICKVVQAVTTYNGEARTIDKNAADLMVYAFDAANNAGKPGDWRYIDGVLSRLEQRGIKTIDDVEDYDDTFSK